MNLSDLVGQEVAVGMLKKALERGSVAHAYLFQGPEGVGKRTAALLLARALNCPEGGCGRCESCRKIEAGSHPDVRMIGPADGALAGASTELLEALGERAMIGIGEMRPEPDKPRRSPPPLLEDAYLKPYSGPWKAYIVDPADRMTDEAANALLHVLEEPPAHVLLILVTCRPDALLPTVVSRCQPVRFRPARLDQVEAALNRKDVNGDRARLIALLSGGRVGWAMQVATRPEWLATRARLLEWLCGLSTADFRSAVKRAAELRELALSTWEYEYEQAGAPALNLPQVADVLGNQDDELEESPAEGSRLKLSRNQILRARLPLFFDIMATWYRDALQLKIGRSRHIINQDMRDRLADQAKRSPGALASAVAALAEAKDYLRRNANVDLTLQHLMLRLLAG